MTAIPESQRASELKQHAKSNRKLRPVLTSINGNVAWILSFPYPPNEPSPSNGKKYYHALLDPWFGEEVVFASYYFLRMHLQEPAALKDRNDVETVIREIEVAAGGDPSLEKGSDTKGDSTLVDGIFIAGRVEHCSKPSVMQFSPSTPVFVTSLAHAIVDGWKHFDTVVELRNFMPSYADEGGKEREKCWTDAYTGSPLPKWLCAMMLQTIGMAQNNFAMVLMYSSQNDEGGDLDEAIVVAAHGVSSAEASLKTLLQPPPPSSDSGGSTRAGKAPKLLALLAPYNESFQLNTCVTFGADEALAVAQYPEDGLKYYVPNGDTPLVLNGVLSWTQSYLSHDLEWGRQQLIMGKGTNGVKYDADYKWKLPTQAHVGNGESYVLA